MYNDNEDNDLSRVTPEEHKEEPITTNFTVRDADQTEVKHENQPVDGQSSYQENRNHAMNQNQQPYGQTQQMGQNPYQSSQNVYRSANDSQRMPNQQALQNHQYDAGRQGIPHYQEHQYQRMAQGAVLEAPDPPKKKSGFAKRVAAIVGGALLFGVIAGCTMVGINWISNSNITGNQVGINESAPLPSSDNSQPALSKSASAQPTSLSTNLDVSGIVEKSMPSVVAITSKVIYESQTWFGPMQQEGVGSGSGIIVGKNDSELLIVTNNHVVQGSQELKVTFIDQTAVDAAIKGTDADSDLAVIAVPLKDIPSDTQSKISIAALGDSDSLKVGQGVIAIGNALGYGQSVTVGYISALNRTVQTENGESKDLLQTDAAINPGNSGGALINMQGQVIGINAAKYASEEVEGMGYAIPITKAQNVINTLITKKTRTQVADADQGYLGIQCTNIDAATSQQLGMPQGVFVYKIVEGGAASQSDLHEKDIITKFDGQGITSYEDLTNMLKYYEGGTKVTLTVQSLDNGKYAERNVDITLDKKPADNSVNDRR